jgi:hypothetical protein
VLVLVADSPRAVAVVEGAAAQGAAASPSKNVTAVVIAAAARGLPLLHLICSAALLPAWSV